jgi:hypothetical protein
MSRGPISFYGFIALWLYHTFSRSVSQHEKEFCVAKCNRSSGADMEMSSLNVNKKLVPEY